MLSFVISIESSMANLSLSKEEDEELVFEVDEIQKNDSIQNFVWLADS